MRKTLALALVCCLLTGCSARAAGQNRYEASFLGLFDTVTTIVGYADSEEEFRAQAQSICDRLLEYHQLFDIYQEYPGISNLKTVNDRAGGGPVKVDRAVMDLLLFCREMAGATSGAVDVTLGAALALWHDAREAGVDDPEHA
ncbi:MAG: FAD:protein FMN transferase, partial [Clostridiales bacterium]|nr:FAD:protein FMN transferase [Clostridiales bacterium]